VAPVCGTIALSYVLLASSGAMPAATPLRPQSDRLHAAVELAWRASETFRSIVEALAGSDVIVVIVPTPCDFGRRAACLVHQVVIAGRHRFFRIQVRDDVPYPRLAGLIGHELWHVLEAVRADVRDADGFQLPAAHPCEQQYSQHCIETDEAGAVQGRVVDEVSERRFPGQRR
jgi:hypothetical protein